LGRKSPRQGTTTAIAAGEDQTGARATGLTSNGTSRAKGETGIKDGPEETGHAGTSLRGKASHRDKAAHKGKESPRGKASPRGKRIIRETGNPRNPASRKMPNRRIAAKRVIKLPQGKMISQTDAGGIAGTGTGPEIRGKNAIPEMTHPNRI
jgi:hypothetical protein